MIKSFLTTTAIMGAAITGLLIAPALAQSTLNNNTSLNAGTNGSGLGVTSTLNVDTNTDADMDSDTDVDSTTTTRTGTTTSTNSMTTDTSVNSAADMNADIDTTTTSRSINDGRVGADVNYNPSDYNDGEDRIQDLDASRDTGVRSTATQTIDVR